MPRDDLDEFERFLARERRGVRGLRFSPLKIVFALLLVASVVVAAVIVQQSLLPPTVTGAVLTENCDPLNPIPPTVISGTSGYVIWECDVGVGAFTVNGAGTVTPTISKGSEWTTTFIYKLGTGTTPPTIDCLSASHEKPVSSGTAVAFVAADAGEWAYCSDFSNAQDPMTPIDYSWDQA